MAKAKSVATPSPVSDDDWQVEDALRTLTRAEEIQDDPKLMAKIKKLATEKIDDMSHIVGRLVKSGRIGEKQAAKLERKANART